jgi:hypothetical protein
LERGLAQPGFRALVLGTRGRAFKSRIPDFFLRIKMRIPGTPFSDVDPIDPFGQEQKVIMQALYDLVLKTAVATEEEMKLHGEELLFGCCVEELGEYAAARIVEKGFKKKKLKENSMIEALDLTICALSLFFANGGTIAELGTIGQEKLKKWEDRILIAKEGRT